MNSDYVIVVLLGIHPNALTPHKFQSFLLIILICCFISDGVVVNSVKNQFSF